MEFYTSNDEFDSLDQHSCWEQLENLTLYTHTHITYEAFETIKMLPVT